MATDDESPEEARVDGPADLLATEAGGRLGAEVDLTLVTEFLRMTPTERVRWNDRVLNGVRRLRGARPR